MHQDYRLIQRTQAYLDCSMNFPLSGKGYAAAYFLYRVCDDVTFGNLSGNSTDQR